MNTKLQPVLRAIHRIFPVSRSPELSPCLPNGDTNDQKYTILRNEDTREDDAAQKTPSRIEDRNGSKKELTDESQSSSVKKTQRFKDSFRCCRCPTKRCLDFIKRVFPFVTILKNYSPITDLPCDVIAGLTVGIMHIPQGMAYALLTQLPPVYGLYTSFFPVLVYFFFGSSKHISVGTFAVITMMIGTVVDKGHIVWQQNQLNRAINDINMGIKLTHFVGVQSEPTSGPSVNGNNTGLDHLYDREQLDQLDSLKVGYAMAVTFCVGILQVFLGVTSLGFLTSFMSDPLISGFTTASAVLVFSSQMKSAFGVKVQRFSGPFKIIFLYVDFFSKIGHTNWITLLATIGAIVVLLVAREGINNRQCMKKTFRGIPVPGELILIIAGTVLSIHFSLHQDFDVEVIGHIPKGFPSFSFTFIKYVPDVIGDAFAICFTAFVTSFAIAKILADSHNYTVDPNQELVAHGLSNVFGSMFSSFCSSASLSRSMVQNGAGGRTQVVSLVSSGAVIVVLLYLGPLFESLPNSILAGIVMVSLKGMFIQFGDVPKLWRVSRIDCSVWLVSFTTTLLLDVDLGLLIGIVYNLIPILLQTQRPKLLLLGRLPGTDVFVNMNEWPDAEPVPGIQIFKYDAPLYFANAESFRVALIKETAIDPHILRLERALKKDSPSTLQHHKVSMTTPDKIVLIPEQNVPPVMKTFAIIIEGSSIQSMDSGIVSALTKMTVEYRDVGIEVFIAECRAEVCSTLTNPHLNSLIHRRNVCATVAQAVQVAQKIADMSPEDVENTNTIDPEDFLDGGRCVKVNHGASAELAVKLDVEDIDGTLPKDLEDFLDSGRDVKINLGASAEAEVKPDAEVINVEKIELRMNNEFVKDFLK